MQKKSELLECLECLCNILQLVVRRPGRHLVVVTLNARAESTCGAARDCHSVGVALALTVLLPALACVVPCLVSTDDCTDTARLRTFASHVVGVALALSVPRPDRALSKIRDVDHLLRRRLAQPARHWTLGQHESRVGEALVRFRPSGAVGRLVDAAAFADT